MSYPFSYLPVVTTLCPCPFKCQLSPRPSNSSEKDTVSGVRFLFYYDSLNFNLTRCPLSLSFWVWVELWIKLTDYWVVFCTRTKIRINDNRSR